MKDNRKYWIAPTVLALLLIASIAWGYNQYETGKNLSITLDNHYQRLFHDVKRHVEDVQVGLSKALVASSKERNIQLFSQIMNDANFAQDKLGQMPISHSDVSHTEKFLAQAADYSYYLIQKHLDGEDITPEQRKTLTDLQENSSSFNGELAAIYDSLGDPNYIYGVAAMNMDDKDGRENAFQTSLTDLSEDISETPELIYDGPFADQILHKKPLGLGNKNVDKNKAERIARDFFGGRVKDVDAFEEGEDMDQIRIPAHTFNLYPENQQKDLSVNIGVSKKGGKVIWYSNPRPITEQNISVEEAEDYALRYLKEKGFSSMEANYSLIYDGNILFNFAYKEDDITIYPDLIKVKVALDTGEIVGFDAATYYLNHHKRDFDKPKLDEETAKEHITTEFDIDSIRLALIPKGKEEVLCYEFKGKQGKGDFIVYINAVNGKEEDVLQIIHNDNGTLTF